MRNNLIKLLKFLELNQAELAHKIGVSTSTISNIMIGKSASLSAPALKKLREVFDVNLNWLVTGDENEPIFIKKKNKELTSSELDRLTKEQLIDEYLGLKLELRELKEGLTKEVSVEQLISSSEQLPVAKVRIIKKILELLNEKDELLDKLKE